MGELMCMCDKVQMLTAVCENCKSEDAIFTYYKGKNKSEDILIGDEDLYIPVRRKCYEKLIKIEE